MLCEGAGKTASGAKSGLAVKLEDVHFSYEEGREILRGVDLQLPRGSFTALVGESGCGKSTIAALLMGRNRHYTGEITLGGIPLAEMNEEALLKTVTYVGHDSVLFKGSVRDNLLMGAPDADDNALWDVLRRVNLADFLRGEKGLDTRLNEEGSNFSGGQRQRLALARALLHDSPVYLFDEATSGIDVESENDIMAQIHALAKTKTVLLISHRLANVQSADRIDVLRDGQIVESGTHEQLLLKHGAYAALWEGQQALEKYTEVRA